MHQNCGAIVVAAGSAQRMGGIDKMLCSLGGVPVLLRTVLALANSPRIQAIYVVTRQDRVPEVEALCAGVPKLMAVVPGGSCRAESVLNGLLAAHEPLVAIHDGARPLVTAEVIDAAISAAEECGAAAPAIAVHDTIKTAQDGIVTGTPDRASLFAVQTPQVFRRAEITRALQDALAKGQPLTDDCSAAELAGMEVRLTQGSEENLKITVPTDLVLAEAILQRRERP